MQGEYPQAGKLWFARDAASETRMPMRRSALSLHARRAALVRAAIILSLVGPSAAFVTTPSVNATNVFRWSLVRAAMPPSLPRC